MKIKAILDKKGNDVYSIAPDATLKDVVKEMLALSIGSLLVLNESGGVDGIFTERDFLHNVAKYSDKWESIRVADVMIKDVVVCSIDKTLEQVMGKMTKNRIRHIPIVDGGKVVGMLSIGDIIYASLDETTFQNELMKRYIKDWPEDEKPEIAAQ